MSFKEKLLFYFLVLVFLGSIISWGLFYYYSKTKPVAAYGGEYIEGIVGQPRNVNPLLAASNQTDADISSLVYSSLFKYDGQGKLAPDLAEGYDLSPDHTTYTVHLRKSALWQDGQPVTADDVVFTINLLSDPSYGSPLRGNWQGITTTKVDDYTLRFKISTPYAAFLDNLTFGILPKHLWDSVSSDNFSLNSLNLEPIGSGPFKFDSLQKDPSGNILSYSLDANPSYFAGRPYISKITFDFYTDENAALADLNSKKIMGISVLSSQNVANIKNQKSVAVYKFNIPRYYAVFFNQTKSLPLADDNVRLALDYATDRQAIINQILNGDGQPAYSPFLPGMLGYSTDIGAHPFDLNKANQILDSAGWTRGPDGFRAKNGTALVINLVTTDWNQLSQTAAILKSQWEKAGAKVNVSTYSISDIQQNYIRPREYDALLFGQVVGADPDPYSFWHSDNKKDPGLNLALYGNSTSDTLIENGRTEFDPGKRARDYVQFQQGLEKEVPAVFLYSPEYIYPTSTNLHGLDAQTLVSPEDRFWNVNQWYIETKRVRK
jgi:peptide/nickel transport system substrate-binding protein